MTTLMESPVGRDLARLRRRFRQMLEDPFTLEFTMPAFEERRGARRWWSPTVEMSETPAEYTITAELPGISAENVEIQVADGVLTLKGSKTDERKVDDAQRRYHLWEREYGSFERTFPFAAEVDAAKVEASFGDGVLVIKVPKAPRTAAEVRTVPIAKRK